MKIVDLKEDELLAWKATLTKCAHLWYDKMHGRLPYEGCAACELATKINDRNGCNVCILQGSMSKPGCCEGRYSAWCNSVTRVLPQNQDCTTEVIYSKEEVQRCARKVYYFIRRKQHELHQAILKGESCPTT